jgi:O-antigen ligase
MTAISLEIPFARAAEKPSHAVRMLQVFCVTLMVFPGDYTIHAIGGDGYAAALVSYLMFIVWGAGSILGHHNPWSYRYPIRITLAGMWVVSLASYLLMNRGVLTGAESTAADRWFMQLVGMSGILLVAAEGLHTLEDVRRVLRALTWAGAFCGIVAGLQFKTRIDLTKYLKLPGFSVNAIDSANAEIIQRGSLNRVPGTATDPIELGVAAGMLLALALYLMMHDTDRPKWQRIFPIVCIAVAIAASVSRSAIIAAAVALGVLIISLPPVRRLKGLAAIPVALGVAFVSSHGLIGTLSDYFLAGNSDPSISHRTNNYQYVEQLVRQSPWFGQGGGSYIAASQVHILDNQYLTTAIELGLLGVAALIFYLAWPAVIALVARHQTTNPEMRDLCAALAGADLAAVICAGTFDGFSFPMFFSLQALVAGLVGAVWMMVRKEQDDTRLDESGGNA